MAIRSNTGHPIGSPTGHATNPNPHGVPVRLQPAGRAPGRRGRRVRRTARDRPAARRPPAGSGLDSTRFSCDPASGEHTRAQTACEEIAAANGDFTQLGADDSRICTYEYDPVTVFAFGVYRGEPVQYVEEFPNRCAMENETGSVFSF
ncbi:SSI family serine proteinase inhibitor [Saccharothrix xinjiangensis]|uniref:SSI family serine proteinase inhibitor n=1 Tax=Saccharothrix xinjiangensis TaxID=204798 RepID=A0ABV9Y172_9PSEU